MSTLTLTDEELNNVVDRRIESVFRARSDRRWRIAFYVFGVLAWATAIASWVLLLANL